MNTLPPALTLPTAITTSIRRDPRMLLIYGPPKIGKTTMLAQLQTIAPNRNLIVETDPRGAELVSCLSLQVNSMAELTTVIETIKAQSKTTGKRPYDFIAFDTIDKIEEWAEIEATAAYKKSSIGCNFTGASVLELPKGGGYLHLRRIFTEMLYRTFNLADNIIFVSHIRDKMIESVAGKGDVSAKDLDLTGKIKSIVCSMVDGIGYVSRDKDQNMTISFVTQEDVVCGSRCPHLKGQKQTHQKQTFDWAKIYPDYASAHPILEPKLQ